HPPEEVVAYTEDQARAHDRPVLARASYERLGIALRALVTARGSRVRAVRAHVHEPRHAGPARCFEDVPRALNMYPFEGRVVAFPDDPHEVDDGVRAAHGRLQTVSAHDVSLSC